MKILCIGPIWRGSNAGGLFKALARNGALIEVVDEFYQIPLSGFSFPAKVVSKLFRKIFISDYNEKILFSFEKFNPDFVLVYKGAFVFPSTLKKIKSSGVPIFNFYPDVSFHTHGPHLKNTLGLYDKIFTTKSFGKKDYQSQLGVKEVIFIPHGFDPEIHKKIDFKEIPLNLICDVSFIGTYSPKKEKILEHIAKNLPDVNLKIWGTQWEKSSSKFLYSSIQNFGVFGDLYAAAINGSKINLGILSEKVKGASSGDLITSRTFHIPGAGGFLMHEKTPESILFFKENEEAAFFENEDDLVSKIDFYLKNPNIRDVVREAGYSRAYNEHSLDIRAKSIIKHF